MPPKKPPTEPPKPPARGKPTLTVVSAGPKKAAGGKSKPGPAPHVPTDQLRALAMMCGAVGYDKQRAARTMKVGDTVFRTHYLLDWEKGSDEATLKVAGTLFAIATDKAHPRAATAGIFWMKARAGWRDRDAGDEGDGDEGDTTEIIQIGIGGAKGG